jgi:hypothetical protein
MIQLYLSGKWLGAIREHTNKDTRSNEIRVCAQNWLTIVDSRIKTHTYLCTYVQLFNSHFSVGKGGWSMWPSYGSLLAALDFDNFLKTNETLRF